MRFRKIIETDVGHTTRCGRCATILPDETMSYCPACGALFSQVPPTNSYTDLVQRRLERRFLRERLKFTALAFAAFFVFFACYGLVNVVLDQIYIRDSLTQFREVRFYFYDFNGLPKLPEHQKREAIAIGLQAFEDHFHFALKRVSIREGEMPAFIGPSFKETQKILDSGKANPLTLPIGRMSFWEKNVFPPMVRRWQNAPDQTLDVLITNLPVRADSDISSDIETRHLGSAGLVSGLANPGMVIVSTYRVHNDNPELALDRPPTQSEDEKARFIGEFIIAHELGHALLGLGDVVLEPKDYEGPVSQPVMRSPASIGARGIDNFGNDYRQCLMHTDSGGGFLAWDSMRKRMVGQSSTCHAYDAVTEAFKLRFESLQLLKLGLREQAEQTHQQAIDLASQPNAGWVARSWENEHYLFAPLIKRWTFGMFMFQSRHDQLRFE